MIVKMLATMAIPKPRLYSMGQSNSFVIMKLIKKRLQQRQQKKKAEPETYSASSQQKQKAKQQQQNQIFEREYDFFSRQKQIELNKDYRKIRQQSQFIPQDIGKGGFDQVVYWSEFAKTPEQVLDLVKVFNRFQMPEEIGDKVRFQSFGDRVMNTMYMSNGFNALQEFATFGFKFNIDDQSYWKKIEEKAIRTFPKTPEQIKDCIQIAYIMSKVHQGQLIYSSLYKQFKDVQLTAEDKAKLLLIYANTQTGQREWIQQLTTGFINNLADVRKQVFILAFQVFKKSKNIPDNDEKKIFARIKEVLPELNFVELCSVGQYVGHGKMPQTFWKQVEAKITPLVPTNKPKFTALHLLQFLSCYSISTQFIRKFLIPLLQQNNHELLRQLPPQILSSISKILYIYELEAETKEIEEIIETNIIKTFNTLKNVKIDNLIKVLKDYTITRVGSREFYIFLEQVADALFSEISKNREHLRTLCALYENSELCSAEFLQKLRYKL